MAKNEKASNALVDVYVAIALNSPGGTNAVFALGVESEPDNRLDT
jgi:hypothetical protein